MTDPSRGSIERRLERFIVEELVDERYDGRDPLAAGVVDSLGLEQLVDYIEDEFGFRVSDTDVVRENFGSLPALTAFVESRLPAGDGS